MLRAAVLCMLALCMCARPGPSAAKPPHILFIVSDDLGFNDVSFHGSPQIPTPNIDELAHSGVILNNHHVQPVCSPSRSTFMSGRHVIHTGVYMPFSQATALRLNLSYTLLPGYLKKLNYSTHMVGKWHLGQNVLKALPTGRGFDTYFGYWSGAEDYYTHTTKNGYDFNNNLEPAFEYKGQYSEPIFSKKAVDVIRQFNASSPDPMFLYLAYQAPQAYLDQFAHVPDRARQYVCAMAKIMDDGIGNVTKALKAQGIFDDTLIVFSADNGGPTDHNEGTNSNNYPLRGGKNTLFEGGTRVSALVSGAGIKKTGYVSYEKMHAADWLATLVSMASGDDWRKLVPEGEPAYLLGDGMNVWEMLSEGAPSPRTELLHEAHPGGEHIIHGNALTVGDMKAIRVGPTCPEKGWYPPPGQDPSKTPYQLQCPPIPAQPFDCSAKYCLFNVTADPCETEDLAATHPEVLSAILDRLAGYQVTAVPPVGPEGCAPVLDKRGAWRPCDDPSLALGPAQRSDT